MGAAQGAADPVAAACSGLWRCPTRSRPTQGACWQAYQCGGVPEITKAFRGRGAGVAEAKCFDEALHFLSRDLERLAEWHRREQASATKKVSRLSEDKESLARKVAKLETLLSTGGCGGRAVPGPPQARTEDSDSPQVSLVSKRSLDEQPKCDNDGAGFYSSQSVADSTVHPEDVVFLGDSEDQVTGHRASCDVAHMAQMLRSSKLRSSWDELTDETLYAFSPKCSIEVVNVHRRMTFGCGGQRQNLRATVSTRKLAASQEDQSMISLCLFKAVLHPNGRPRLLWTSLALIALLYDTVTIPLGAFHLSEVAPALNTVDWALLIFWTLDIFMAFRTGYYVMGKVELRPYYIAVNYLKTWFFLDIFIVLVGFVSELAIMSAQPSALIRVARFFRILRILRLLRIAKLKAILEHIEDRINSNVMHLLLAVVKLVTGLAVIVHFSACTWYAVGASSDHGWQTYDAAEGPKDFLFWYSASLRWTLAQVNGRTDVDDRRTMVERMFTCLVAGVLAIILMAVFISSITAAMMELGSIAEERKKKVRRINEFLKKNQISASLTALIKHHSVDAKTIEQAEEDDSEILSYLPKTIQSDLFYEIRAPLLLGHPLFSSINVESKKVMWQLCNEAMLPVIAEKDKVLFDLNDSCSKMLIIVKGVMSYSMPEDYSVVRNDSELELPELEEAGRALRSIGGHVISEAALWVEWHNRGRLRATTTSYVVALSAAAFGDAVKQHLVAHARSIAYARAYVLSMRELDELSDVMEVKAYFHQPPS